MFLPVPCRGASLELHLMGKENVPLRVACSHGARGKVCSLFVGSGKAKVIVPVPEEGGWLKTM